MTKQQDTFFLSKFEEHARDHPELHKPRGSSKPKKSDDCTGCGLKETCISGRLERYGKGKKDILVVGTCPDKASDGNGVVMANSGGDFLKDVLDSIGISLYKDCVRTYLVQCANAKKNKSGRLIYTTAPTNKQFKCCKHYFEQDILEVKPKLIICCGGTALHKVLSFRDMTYKSFKINQVHGKTFPVHRWNCWAGASFDPSHIIHGNNRERLLFGYDLIDILEHIDEPLPMPLTKEGNILIESSTEAVVLFEEMSASELPVSFDYETNSLSAFDKDAKLLTVSLSNDITKGYCIYLNNPKWNAVEQAFVYHAMKQFLLSDAPKVVQNINMEEIWGDVHVGATMNNFHWDTMVSYHVLNCRKGTTGLDHQVYELTGHEYKEMVDKENLESEPIEILSDYNNWDSRYQLMAYYDQKNRMDEGQLEFNRLLHNALPAFAAMKNRGIRIDIDLLDKMHSEYADVIKAQSVIILSNPGVITFKKKYNKEINIDSPKQLEKVLYDILKEPSVKKTKTGESTDEDTLNIIVKKTKNKDTKKLLTALLRHRKITKFLAKINEYKREADSNGYIHPSYNLNIAETYRSSSNGPQVHNVYKRDEELKKFRKVFIPSEGNFYLEVDYDGLEVKVISMASQDPELIRQLVAGQDPHRRWGSEIYQIEESKIDDKKRYNAKNGFVFPSFYGSVAKSIAKSFPEISLTHIMRVQEKFWSEYAAVKVWQNEVLETYSKNGYVRGLTGFKRPGPLSDNQLFNTPIQGTAFHLLLDALWRAEKEMRARGMGSNIVSEVHDSLLIDTVPEELEDVIELIEGVMCSKRFSWQTVPITVSWEYGPNWYDMEKF